MRVDIAAVDDLEEGRPIVVQVRGREIAITKWRGEIYALKNVCPHQSQSFELGLVRDRVTADSVGECRIRGGAPILACPWHGWQFDLATGECVTDRRYRARSYPVAVEAGRILVDVAG